MVSDQNPTDTGFPRRVRLTQSAQFNAVFRQRLKTFRAAQVRILCKPNRMPSARLGLVIAKRVIPKAHDRNRIKRVIRDAFRHERQALPPWDMVVQLTGPANAKQVRAAMDQLMHEMKRYHANQAS